MLRCRWIYVLGLAGLAVRWQRISDCVESQKHSLHTQPSSIEAAVHPCTTLKQRKHEALIWKVTHSAKANGSGLWLWLCVVRVGLHRRLSSDAASLSSLHASPCKHGVDDT